MKDARVGIVVPAYNEATVIQDSLKALSEVTKTQHIYVVSDGSTDRTAALAKKIIPNVLNLRKNRGKAGALKALIDRYQLTKKYQYIFFFDADTRISRDFLDRMQRLLRQQSPALVVGTVSSGKNGLISAYRVYEYGFSHLFFKNAQNAMGTIVVAPGCASIYRADVLDKLDFSNHTLTEDLDLTMQIHYRKLGKIVYLPQARVSTQDPQTLRDYWNQINRWNTGFWQNFFMHKLYIPNKRINWEILLVISDVVMWLAVLGIATMHPLLFLKLYATAMLLSSAIGLVTALAMRAYWAMPYAPLFGLFHGLNLASLIYSFFRATFSKHSTLSWQKVGRYALR